VQNYFIFTDNVCILCLLCNEKKSKTTDKLSEKSRNKRHSNSFQWCPLSRQYLYCYHFLLSIYMNQVPEKLYQVLNKTTLKFILHLYEYSKSHKYWIIRMIYHISQGSNNKCPLTMYRHYTGSSKNKRNNKCSQNNQYSNHNSPVRS
jgi:hypothetical protein